MRRFDFALNAKIDMLHRLACNANAMGLERSWEKIMIALGGALMKQRFGRRSKVRL